MLLRSSSTPGLASLLTHQEVTKEVDFDCDSLRACRGLNRSLSRQSHFSAAVATTTSYGSKYISSFDDHIGRLSEVRREIDSRSRIRRAQSESDLASLSNGFACKSSAKVFISPSTNDGGDLGEDCFLHRQWCRRLKHGSYMGPADRYSGLERGDSIQEENDYDTRTQSDDLNVELEVDQLLQGSHVVDQVDLRSEETCVEDLSSVSYNNQSVSAADLSISGKGVDSFTMEDGEVYTSFAIGRNGSPVVCNSRGCRPLSESEKLSPMYVASGLDSSVGGGYFGGSSRNAGFVGYAPDPNSTEAYYEKLLQDDPLNPLVLRNFAQFLFEVKHDNKRAEEYYERAVLASPSDGDILSHYAKLVWDVHKDQNRAESYYNQAVKVAPDDSYVLASYASFLWDTEDNERVDPSSPDAPLRPTLQGQPTLMASA